MIVVHSKIVRNCIFVGGVQPYKSIDDLGESFCPTLKAAWKKYIMKMEPEHGAKSAPAHFEEEMLIVEGA